MEQSVGVLNFHSNVMKQTKVYVAMRGDFTAQRQIVKNPCQIDAHNFNIIYHWLKQNNINFTNIADSELCPNSIILEDETNSDEHLVNPTRKKVLEIQY